MAERDWDESTVIRKRSTQPKVMRKESEVNSVRRSGGVLSTDRKGTPSYQYTTNKGQQGLDYRQVGKIAETNDVVAPPKLAQDVPRAIMQRRNELKMNQGELARRINEKPTVITAYEQGKAIPTQQVLTKLERALGIKLRGTNIGSLLPQRGSK
ncbi:multiprotein-bridging factor 1 [Tieghemiomyces parasiticus]|uniref:Multiprotein-bridging factor 1 n=1 Tax=Tieghemiomyces parasiticus TaxID=78921 RepID=A0A9W8AE85_9FUNG|nr:multiprotein-bridging factor 1 [Tieghemiomyces parasiticus]